MVKIVRYAPVLLLFGVIPLACSQEPITVDNTCTAPVACEELADCYSEGNYELGTECRNNLCLCPEWEGMSPLPCCRKGADPFNCKRQCRPIEECEPEQCAGSTTPNASSSGAGGGGTGGAGGAGGTGAASGGAPPMPQCETSAECAQPEKTECGAAQCVDGACVLNFKPLDTIPSQIKGDCVSNYCDGLGGLVTLPDGEDSYNDGRQCTIDLCVEGEPKNIPFPDGSPCPETGVGYCYNGECVECIATLTSAMFCANQQVCVDVFCVPAHCENQATDLMLGETDYNCGGPCPPCPLGFNCATSTDCFNGPCISGKCEQPSCNDGVMDDGETGVDCGGVPSCPLCPEGQACLKGDDCQSSVCWAGICEPATCKDGKENGEETGIDCGQSCNVTCP